MDRHRIEIEFEVLDPNLAEALFDMVADFVHDRKWVHNQTVGMTPVVDTPT